MGGAAGDFTEDEAAGVLTPKTSVDLNFDSVFRLKNAMVIFCDARRAWKSGTRV